MIGTFMQQSAGFSSETGGLLHNNDSFMNENLYKRTLFYVYILFFSCSFVK